MSAEPIKEFDYKTLAQALAYRIVRLDGNNTLFLSAADVSFSRQLYSDIEFSLVHDPFGWKITLVTPAEVKNREKQAQLSESISEILPTLSEQENKALSKGLLDLIQKSWN